MLDESIYLYFKSVVYDVVFAGASEVDIQHSDLPVNKSRPRADHVSRGEHVRNTYSTSEGRCGSCN